MYPENPEGTQVIVGSMNMGYKSDTARNRTHNLFRPKQEPIPLGHSDRQSWPYVNVNALSGRMSIEAEIFPGQMTITRHQNYIFVLNVKFHSRAVPRMDLSPKPFRCTLPVPPIHLCSHKLTDIFDVTSFMGQISLMDVTSFMA